jgi:KTSC domain
MSIPVHVQMKQVESSNLAAIGYDFTAGDLYVAFKQSGTYRYIGVPVRIYHDMQAAASKGQFLETKIKGKYEYVKIAEKQEKKPLTVTVPKPKTARRGKRGK